MGRRVSIALPRTLARVLDAVRAAGGRPLVVGGAVRDAAAGRVPKDFDVEAYGIGVEPLAAALGTVGRVHAVGRSFGVLKVALDGEEIDVSLPRRENKAGRGHRGFLVEPDPTMKPEEAASRRDFTINAMAWDPATGELLDFFGGADDLERGTLRHVGPAFVEDPLRVLRGVQLAGRFRLTAAPETVELSRRLLGEYDTLAAERVWGEWQKWAARSAAPSCGLRFLAASGWIARYPELVALDGCPQDAEWHPEGDVWTHTLLVTDRAAELAERDGLAEDDRRVLLLAALCHDLGKPETTLEDAGRIRSPNHAACTGTMQAMLDRLGSPPRTAARVVALGRQHLSHMSFQGSARHVRRLARALGEDGETIEMLARLVEADHSARPPLPGGLPEPMVAIVELARELETAAAAPRPLVGGRDLIALGLVPGPELGRILRAAYEAQLDGEFDTPEGARRWVRERFDV